MRTKSAREEAFVDTLEQNHEHALHCVPHEF